MQVCADPNCPELTAGTLCPTHEAQRRKAQDQRRGNFRQRGYDGEYERNKRRVLAEEHDCWICHHAVDKTLKHPHPGSASIDHIVRRVDAGTNARDNLRLAHLGCNSSRR